MALSASVHIEEGAPQNAAPCGYVPKMNPSGFLPRRSASGSHIACFQITASSLGLRACMILCVPFKSRVFVPYSHLDFPNSSPAGLHNQIFWGLNYLGQDA